MLAYVLGITKRGKKITNWGRDIKLGKEISNRGKRNYNPGQGLQISAEHSATVFEYSESESCSNSKVVLLIFTFKGYHRLQRLLCTSR